MSSFALGVLLLVVGFVAGRFNEKRHYRSIELREKESSALPAVSFRNCFDKDSVSDCKFVSGSVVVSTDYFKNMVASLINIFGGRIVTYESLVDRARREALLRMKKEAGEARVIANVRIETSTIGGSANKRRSVGSIEALAYGTAIY